MFHLFLPFNPVGLCEVRDLGLFKRGQQETGFSWRERERESERERERERERGRACTFRTLPNAQESSPLRLGSSEEYGNHATFTVTLLYFEI